MVYKRYIYRDGKKFGPYYYHTYRDKHGKTHSRYVEDENEIRAVTKPFGKVSKPEHIFAQHKTLFILLGIIALFLITLMILNNSVKQEGASTGSSGFSFKTLGDNIKSFVTGFTSEGTPEPAPETPSDSEGSSSTSGTTEPAPETTTETPTDTTSTTETPITETPAEATPTETQPTETAPEIPAETTVPQEETNQTQPSEEVANETIPEPETNGTQETNVTEQTNETVSNETTPGEENEGGGAGIIGNVTNETIINGTINNETIFNITNETLGNFTLENGTLVNETNVTIINETANITLDSSVKQFSAVIGQPVRWEKRVKVGLEGTNSTSDLIIDLPKDSGNVSVRKISNGDEGDVNVNVLNDKTIKEIPPIKEEVSAEKQGSSFLTNTFNFFLGFFRGGLTGRAVEGSQENVSVQINDEVKDNDEIVLEYYTDAPYTIEEEKTNGKTIRVVGSENVHYENVLIFSNLSENLSIKDSSKIKVYWEENAIYIPYSNVIDTNENGVYDYIEFIAPRLSNQTFNIIVITQAEHLDPNRTFISDIYDEVKSRDGIWSEEIPDGHYVRVTFERNLTISRDISIWPRVVNGTPRIEVYEEGGSVTIAEFESLVENEYNKIYLESLQGEQDTFDLKILGGSVEFDHIIDPVSCGNGECYLNDSDILADIFAADEDLSFTARYRTIMKWNISAATGATSSDWAELCLYIGANAGITDSDATITTTINQTWDETLTTAGYDSLSFINSSTYNFNSTTANTWGCVNVTVQINACIKGGYGNCTIHLDDPDQAWDGTAGAVTDDATILYFSEQISKFDNNRITFRPSEYSTTSQRPYLKFNYSSATADAPPVWSSNSTNSTGHGLAVKHNVYWTDDTNLSGYIFSFDNGSGTFANDSFTAMIGTTNWSNVTKVVNNTIGSTIQWKVYANDSTNQWNATSTFSYLTTDNPPVVNLLSPENNSIISNPYINESFTSNVSDDLNITRVEWWADFRGSGWQLEQTNSTTGLTNAIYNFTFNFSNWFASQDYLITSNLSHQNGRAISGNATHFFMTSYQDDLIKWFDRATNTNVSQFSLPTTWVTGMDTNGTHTYMLDMLNANPIRQTYDNGTVITSCKIFGSGIGTLTGISFDNDSTTLWVLDNLNDALRHYNPDCSNIENISIVNSVSDSYHSLTIDKNNYAYIRDTSTVPDQIKVIYLEDGSNPYNISDIDGLVGDDAGGARGTWIDKTDTYPEKLYSSSSSSSNRLTYIQRRLSGSMVWNVNASDNNSQSSWGNSNYTVIFDTLPSVTLTSPENGTVVSSVSAVLNCSAFDYDDLANISLYGNWGGGWHLNQTIEITGDGNTSYDASFTISGLTELQDYLWNCLAYDNRSQSEWGNSNYTFTYGDCGLTQVSSSTTLTANQCEHYNITANNVVFDCAGYTINGNNSYGNWGVDALNRDNVTIKNCRLEQYAKGIRFFSTNNSVVQNSTLYNISFTNTTSIVGAYGIDLENTYNSTIKDSNLSYFWTNTTTPFTCIISPGSFLYAIYLNNSYNDMINSTIINNVNGQYYGDTSSEFGGCQAGYIDIGQGIVSPTGSYNVTEFKILESNISDIYSIALDMEHFVNLSINNSRIYGGGSVLAYLGQSECCSDSATLYNNQFNSSSNGVVMGGTGTSFISGRIVVDRNIFSDFSSDALQIADVLPAFVEITNNNFYNSSANYVEVRFKNGTISNNVIDDSRGGVGDYGFYMNGVATNITMDNNTILNMTGPSAVGVYLLTNPDNLNITRLNITNCRTGLSLVGADNVAVTNSTISNCNVSDVAIASSYNVQFYNVSFNKSQATISSGFFMNYYQFRANVTDSALNPITSASVDVRNVYGSPLITNDLTAASGLSAYNWIMEYNQTASGAYAMGCTGSAAGINCSTPHNVTAYKTGYSTNSSNFTVNISQTGWLSITTPYITAYVPVTDNFTISEPNNQTFSITYSNASPVDVKWFINGTRQTAYNNLSQFNWTGNYSQAGTYQIKVNISNAVGEDDQIWIMTVNDTNTAPTHNNPIFSPTAPDSDQNFSCLNQSTSDPEGSTVYNIYNWLLNGTSLMALNLPFDINSSNTSSGAIKDYSGNNNNATLAAGQTPTWKLGKIGGAYDFDGVDDYMYIPNSYSLNSTHDNMTISFWVNPKTPNVGNNYFIYKLSDIASNSEYSIRLSNSKIRVDIFNQTGSSSNALLSSNVIENNTFSFVAFTYNGTSMRVYINGTLDNSTGTNITLEKNTNIIYLGYYASDFCLSNCYTNVTLDEIRIYNRTLTPDQIYLLYQNGVNGWTNSSTIAGSDTVPGENWTCQLTPTDTIYDGIMKQNSTTISQAFSVAIDLSSKLAQQINWTLASLPSFNQSADGNNGTGFTEYWVNVSVLGGTADLFLKANDNLTTSGGDILLLSNETYSSNSSNSSVPSDTKTTLTTNFSNHKIGDALPEGNSLIYLKFFLNAPAAQPAGVYNNTLAFKVVQTGQSP